MKGKIAVINMTRMGDLLMTGPLIDRLREIHPDHEIHIIAVEGFMPIVEGMEVDEILPVDFNMLTTLSLLGSRERREDISLFSIFSDVRERVRQFQVESYDAIYNISHTNISSILATMMNGPVSGGLHLDEEGYRRIEGRWARYFFAGNLNRGLNPLHLVDINVGLVEGLAGRKERSSLKYKVGDSARGHVRNEEARRGIDGESGPRIVIQCGASEDDKRWEEQKFGQVGRLLREKIGVHVLFVGTGEEKEWAREAAGIMSEGAYILAGETTLSELAAWLETAELLITNDTGTMHLAQAVGTPVLAINLGSALSDETGPYGEGNLILEPEISCFPCSFKVQCPHYECHGRIAPQAVVRVAEDMLNDEVPETYDSAETGEGVLVWRTSFDSDGWWRKWPLTKLKGNRNLVSREIYRELLKWLMEPDIRPDGPDPVKVVNALQRQFSEDQISEEWILDERAIGESEHLMDMANEGIALSEELVKLSGNLQGNIESLGTLADAVSETDAKIRLITLSHEFWRMVSMLFRFGKENLPISGLREQALETLNVYREFHRAVKGLSELYGSVSQLLVTTAARANSAMIDFEARGAGRSEKPEDMIDPGSKTVPMKYTDPAGNGFMIPNNGKDKTGEPFTMEKSSQFASLCRPRMKGRRQHILLLSNGYYIQRELRDAFGRLGHRVTELGFEDNPSFIEELLTASLSADLVVTINHLGFDTEGELASILNGIGLPYVSWFVDRPGFILLDHTAAPGEMDFIFTWERETISEISAYGFERIEFLPLATDQMVFTPGTDSGKGRVRWVANSMVAASADWRNKAGIGKNPDPLLESAVAILLNGRMEARDAIRIAAANTGVDTGGWTPRKLQTYASAVALTTTQQYRSGLADMGAKHGLHLYGDEGWKLLAPEVPFEGLIEYPDGLPAVYRGGIHLNSTSFQMPTAVNQRVFDIPASGGIVVTDDQEDLDFLFDKDGECITYSTVDEADDKLRWVFDNPAKCKAIADRAKERIEKEHTYDHRASEILEKVRGEVGKIAVMVEGG